MAGFTDRGNYIEHSSQLAAAIRAWNKPMLFKPNTNIPYTEEDYIELALAKISRIAQKGLLHSGQYVFLSHEVRETLKELLKNVSDTQWIKRG